MSKIKLSKISLIVWRSIRPCRQIRMRHALWLGIGAVVCAMAVGAAAQDSQRGAVEHFIGTVIRQTATVCPLASPADQAALDLCRSALYGDSAFRRGVAPVVLWLDEIEKGFGGVAGGDVAPDRYEKPKGFSLSLQMTSTAQADRIFQLLAKDGTVVVPLAKTFWAARFGMLVDRFGIPWLINCEGSDQPAEL